MIFHPTFSVPDFPGWAKTKTRWLAPCPSVMLLEISRFGFRGLGCADRPCRWAAAGPRWREGCARGEIHVIALPVGGDHLADLFRSMRTQSRVCRSLSSFRTPHISWRLMTSSARTKRVLSAPSRSSICPPGLFGVLLMGPFWFAFTPRIFVNPLLEGPFLFTTRNRTPIAIIFRDDKAPPSRNQGSPAIRAMESHSPRLSPPSMYPGAIRAAGGAHPECHRADLPGPVVHL